MKIEIIYCAVWKYTPRAIGLMAALLQQFEARIQAITLVPSDSGKFEVCVNGRLIFSKLATGRHTDPDEIIAMIQ